MFRCEREEEDVHSVREVTVGTGRERVVDHRSTESSSTVDRSPDHYSERNTRLDESVVGDELVVGNDGTDVRAGERTHVDHVDSSHRVSSFGDDRVGVDERSGGTKDDDSATGSVDDGVSSDGGVLASEGNSISLNKGRKVRSSSREVRECEDVPIGWQCEHVRLVVAAGSFRLKDRDPQIRIGCW